uniref:Reverse transcriptase Ty1/copia-type domain-containing protein n=1 Tax=Tanacetum cinerariifolium TaxID=118510 RepID=A0A6L2JQY3_TANCI|nr:hypothetical protein [Tanacetum cinerariifolium]
MPRNQDSSRKTMNVEDTSFKAMVAIDGASFDWNYMADDEAPTNMALMDFLDSEKNNLSSTRRMRPGLGFASYNVVTPPPTGLFAPPTIDLSNLGLEEFQHLKFKGYGPKAILTKSGIVPISTARQSSSRTAAPVTAARPINTATPKPLVNVVKPRQNALQKSHSLSKRPFYQQTALKNINLNNKINTAKEIYPTSLTSKSMMEGMLHFGRGAKCGKIIDKDTIRTEATNDESMLWHRRLGHIRFKIFNKLVKENLVRGIFVGYSTISKAFRVYNTRTRKVEENLHITFLENKPMITGGGPQWLFDIDALLESMNYAQVPAGTNSNDFAGKGASCDACQSSLETGPSQDYILMPLWKDSSLFDSSSQDLDGHNKDKHGPSQESEFDNQERPNTESNTKNVNTARPSINIANVNDNTGSININTVSLPVNTATPTYANYLSDPLMPDLSILESLMMLMMIEMRVQRLTTIIWRQIEAIRLFLSYASFMDFTVYQMDVKSAFLYDTIEEEVYVSQPLGFVDPEFPDRCTSSTKKSLSTEFEQLMHKRFQMSSMGELTFFLGQQVEQRIDGIFLSQDKYICDILKKFGFSSVKSASTPMETHKPLSKDANGTDVVVYLYRFQVQPKVSHMHEVKRIFRYLNDQPTLGLWYPKDSPLELIAYSDRDYIDLKFVNQHNMVAYLEKSDDNTAFHQIVDFLSLCSINYALTVSPTIYASYIEQSWNTASSKTINYVKQIHAIVDCKAVVISESSVRSDLLIDDEDGITCLINDEIFENLTLMGYELLSTKLTFQKGGGDSVERDITTDASLVVAQDSDNIVKTLTTAMPNGDIPQGMYTGGSHRRQETMGGTSAQTRSERVLEQLNEPPLSEGHTPENGEGRMEHTFELTDTVPPTSYDLPLTRGYTPGSDEGRLKLLELMNICTTLSNKVTTLKNELSSTKAVYHKSFITLTKRVKKLKTQLNQKKSRAVIYSSDEEEPSLDIKDSLKQERMIGEINKDKNVNLVSEQGKVHKKAEPLKNNDDATVAKTLLNIKRSTAKDKGKGIMQETELPKKIKKREIREIKIYMRIVPDEEIAIDVIPLSTKPPVIVKDKIVKEGKISTYHIIRADESTKRYTSMINFLENINREYLETLWKLVKDKHGNTRPEKDYERVL